MTQHPSLARRALGTAPRATIRRVALAAALVSAAGGAQAISFETEGGLRGDFNTTLSYGLQVRLRNPLATNLGNDNGGDVPFEGPIGTNLHGAGGGAAANPDFNFLNGDDGNLNYKKGDIVSLALKGTHELGLKWGDGWKFLGRGTWVVDTKVDNTRTTPLSQDAKDLAARNVQLLDLWISKDLSIGGAPTTIKLGNQVVSWGEDVFILGGVNSINPLDLRKYHTPGTQLKEIFRPAPMLYFNTGLSSLVNLEGYYQFRWNGFQFDPVGTFFSGADVVGKGQRPAYAPSTFGLCAIGGVTSFTPGTCGDGAGARISPGENVVPIERSDREPPDRGQYGLAMRLKPKSIDAELAFYYMRYHDKLPFTSFVADAKNSSLVTPTSQGNLLGLSYFNEYGQDKDLFGFSLNTKAGPVAVGAEISYRPRDSVAIDPTVPVPAGLATAFAFPFTGLAPGKAMGYSVMDGVSCLLGTGDAVSAGPGKTHDPATCRTYTRGYVEEKKWQAHLTGFYFIEVNSPIGAIMKSLGAAEGYVLAEVAVAHYPKLDTANIPYLIFPSYGVPNKTSWGYVLEVALTYPDAFLGLNVIPQIDFVHDVRGISPNTIPFVEGRKSLFLGVTLDKSSTWKGQIGVSHFWGGGTSNLMRDRSFFAASLAYTF
ncbi:DUF1302 domain-containing protein [Ideonella sp. A 288]|uniref:DUF1302 domain-containing protein n=1 Tax=Ideonella sp. A 288 TaxID=1962181 RepID=UPI000B4BB1DA|nr:DUF1302 domain-containing protein [Ideonella sp. A 288]